MSCYIELTYHPVSQAAQLTINHHEFDRPGSRMQKVLVGKPMNQWLEAATRGYLQWNGFLPELVSEINEIVFEIVFKGNGEDYGRFSAAVQRQAAALSESGFDPIAMKLTHMECFSTKQLLDQMRRLRKSWNISISTQNLMFRRDRLDARLEADLTMDQLFTLIEDYADLISQMQRSADASARPKLAEMRKAWENLLDREVRR